MSFARKAMIGRSREIAELTSSIDAAAEGHGSAWWLSGDAGIGKSRLLEQLASLATARGARVAWGRSWEAGGAPAFWPWIQVLRALVADPEAIGAALDAPSRRAVLAELLPELREPGASAPGAAGPAALAGEEARFQVLDAVSAVLAEVARRARPLVLAFDDIHAADPSSVLLLDFVVRTIRELPLVVVVSCREPDGSRSPVAPLLGALARRSHPLPLGPLAESEVAELVAATTASALAGSLTATIQHATEGNPLFVIEMTRLCAARAESVRAPGAESGLAVPIPATLASTLRERLDAIPAAARTILECGSLVGRELALADAAELAGVPPAEAAGDVRAAVDAALVTEVAPGRFRFAHILIREVCYQALTPARRAVLHARYAETLERALEAGAAHTSWAECAHHWLAAGPAARERAIAALRCTARAASAQHAYEDATQALERALRAWDEGCTATAPRERAELLLELARTRNLAGDGAAAETSCMAVADVARRTGDPELLARAALEQGAVLVYARVDARLVSVLEEARTALPPGDSALRAQVMARLAAAQQPAADPARPMALAREAIAMARRLGDEPALLAVLTSALAALMDFAPPRERLVLNREHVGLAERLGAATLALRGSMRLVVDHLELGEVARARDALARCRELAERIAHPHHQWPVAALEALDAFRAGRFDDGERFLASAQALAERARDPNAARGLSLQRWWVARLRGDDRGVEVALGTLERSVAGLPFGPLLVELLTLLAAAERMRDHPGDGAKLATISPEDLERLFAMHDLSVLGTLADTALALGDARLAARVHAVLGSYADRWVSWGLFGLVVGEPVVGLAGRLAALLGDRDEAVRALEAALGLARERGLAPIAAWEAFHLAELLARDATGTVRAAAILDEAGTVAATLGLDGLGARIERLAARLADGPGASTAPASATPRALSFALTRAGETWQLARDGRVVHLKDSKGMRMLGALVSDPGRERHVLDLVALVEAAGAGGAAALVDTGDAGELLDARARDAYRRRAAELRAELEEAERWNDVGRAERAREELAAIAEELARGVGLGGRERRAAGAAERARVNVQRRLRDAIRRIEEQDAELGRYLARCIRTGTFCCFEVV